MSNEAPTDALRLVPVPYVVLSEAAGLLDCEGYGPLALTLNNLLSAAPASPLPGGGPHKRWSILNHLGESWTPENFGTERQATAYLDGWKRDNPKMDVSKHKVVPVLVTMTSAPTGDA